MIVEDRKHESCPTCHRVKYTGQTRYVCDGCEQIVGPMRLVLDDGDGTRVLDATVHFTDDIPSQYKHFCSWACLAAWLRQFRDELRSGAAKPTMISLPYVSFDDPQLPAAQGFDALVDALSPQPRPT